MKILTILLRKEFLQLWRDASSFILAFILPVLMMLLFGFCINMDSSVTSIAVVSEDESPQAHRVIEKLTGSPHISACVTTNRQQAFDMLHRGKVQGMIVFPVHASRRLARQQGGAEILIATDGSSPNTAQFTALYLQSIVTMALGENRPTAVDIRSSFLYNPAAESRHYIVPGAIALVLAMVGTFLTAMVVAREWERGTIETLLAGAISRLQFVLSKLIPYFLLGMGTMLVCVLCATCILQVPMRGSIWLIFGIAGLFLLSVLSVGLLVSTLVRNQYSASLISLMVAMLPSMLFSGFVFELSSMPSFVQAISYFIPARYLCTSLTPLFLSGSAGGVLLLNVMFMSLSGAFWFILVLAVTPKRLDS